MPRRRDREFRWSVGGSHFTFFSEQTRWSVDSLRAGDLPSARDQVWQVGRSPFSNFTCYQPACCCLWATLYLMDNPVLSEPSYGTESWMQGKRIGNGGPRRREGLIHFWLPGFALPRSSRSPRAVVAFPACYVCATSPGRGFGILGVRLSLVRCGMVSLSLDIRRVVNRRAFSGHRMFASEDTTLPPQRSARPLGEGFIRGSDGDHIMGF